jgi:hypothetical protein
MSSPTFRATMLAALSLAFFIYGVRAYPIATFVASYLVTVTAAVVGMAITAAYECRREARPRPPTTACLGDATRRVHEAVGPVACFAAAVWVVMIYDLYGRGRAPLRAPLRAAAAVAVTALTIVVASGLWAWPTQP